MSQKLRRVKTPDPTITVPEDETYLNAKEIARKLGVAVQTLHLWRSKNIGPVSVRFGRTVRYPKSAFDEWVSAQTEQTARGERVSA